MAGADRSRKPAFLFNKNNILIRIFRLQKTRM